jgi:HAD superfamily hydrolase (TIGR01662 family)
MAKPTTTVQKKTEMAASPAPKSRHLPSEIVLVLGYPASGKTTVTQDYVKRGYVRLNRDVMSGKVDDLLHPLENYIMGGQGTFVLDNLFATRASRKPFIDLGRKHGLAVNAVVMGTSIEDSQYNACTRMMEKKGKILSPEEIKAARDPNLFPPAVLFAYRKDYQKPEKSEGFTDITTVPFVRRPTGYNNKGLWLDYDGCLRRSRAGNKWPTHPDDVETLNGRSEVLKEFERHAFRLLGASNQSAIAKGELSHEDAVACFERTNDMLGVDIEIGYCPHRVPPITCYCRKPMPGMGVHWIEKYKLDPRRVVMVGDMTTDKTFAARCGVMFCDAVEFFERGRWKEYLQRCAQPEKPHGGI